MFRLDWWVLAPGTGSHLRLVIFRMFFFLLFFCIFACVSFVPQVITYSSEDGCYQLTVYLAKTTPRCQTQHVAAPVIPTLL